MTTFRYEDESDKTLPQDERYWRAEACALASEVMIAHVRRGQTFLTQEAFVKNCFNLADEFMAEVRRRKEKA